jgi:hypothetical protein
MNMVMSREHSNSVAYTITTLDDMSESDTHNYYHREETSAVANNSPQVTSQHPLPRTDADAV